MEDEQAVIVMAHPRANAFWPAKAIDCLLMMSPLSK